MKIFIEPNDVLMFRDGRPFAGGDDHFARGSFPPPPSTIYGALRSHLLSIVSGMFETLRDEPDKIPEKLRDEIGTKERLGTLLIAQFSIAKNKGGQIRRYFPVPRDIAKVKSERDGSFYILKPNSLLSDNLLTDLPSGLNHMWYETEEALEAASGFLTEEEMIRYLQGNPPETIIEAKEIYQSEERTGIRKSRSTRSVEIGGLYTVEYYRMGKGYGFALEVNGTTLLPETGILRLGGDHRSAHYESCLWQEIGTEPIKEKIKEDKKFKIILLTPAIFTHGWLPDGIDSNTFEGAILNVKVKMIGACVGKPIGIGGFDIARWKPKTMNKAVPAGSVYYFELRDTNIDNLFDKLWLKSINNNRAKEGFGITLVGGV